MFSFEKKILEHIEKNLWMWVAAAALLIGAYLRFSMRYFVSEDAYYDYLVWYDNIKSLGGFKALSTQVGDYNVLFQTIVAAFSYFPIIPLYAYKALSIFFDLALSVLLAIIVYKNSDGERNLPAVLAFSIVWLSPVVVFNSSMWAQCDSIYAFFTILSLYLLYKEKYKTSFAIFGLAMAFKLQAIFVLPFLLFVYFYKKRFSILHFLEIPVVMWITTLPAIISGRGFFTGFELFFEQTEEYKCLMMDYPSFWLCTAYNYQQTYYEYIRPLAMGITIAVLAGWMIFAIRSKLELNASNFIGFALILTYSAVFFLPAMHERYGYVYEILAILYMFKNKKSIIPCILLLTTTFATYSIYLFVTPITLQSLGIMNLLVYITYCVLFVREAKKSAT